jgi:hypothetical protein
MRRTIRTATLAACLALVGCGPGGPKTHPVQGRVAVTNGEVAALAGGTVEAALEGDPTVRAAGTIEPDGSFELETYRDGALRKGAVAGTYKVRMILPDDDPAARKKAAKAVHPKALRFETSGLSIEVPAASEVRLELPGRP